MLLFRQLLSRRSLVGGMAGLSVACAASAAHSPAAAGQTLDLSAAPDNLRALLKILASTDPHEAVFNFAAGRVYGCITGRAPIPLFGTHSISIARALARPDGSFRLRQHIVGFRTRFDTETVIDELVNPVTGETVKLPLTDYGVSDSDYRFDGTFALGRPEPLRFGQLGPRPWSQAGGIVALSDDALVTTAGPLQPKVDVVTRFARTDELLDSRIASAASWFSFSAVDPFRPWLKMTEPGLQLWHVYGRKVRSPAEMPQYVQRVAAERFPKLFELPPFAATDR